MSTPPSLSPDRWRSAVYRHLERNKRYPSSAERRRIGGTVRARFTIDSRGNILSFSITASSGHAELDDAVRAMLRRASPVPAPPADLYRSGLNIEVPITFSPR
jgi:protein TonB